jgi:hypothetical protein
MARKREKKPATVTVRFANGGSTMAKKKGGGKKPRKARKNPSNPRRRSPRRKHNPSRRPRRRNPGMGGGSFGDRAMKLAGGALVAIATGVAVYYGQAKIQPGTSLSLYGVPAAAFLAGAYVAKKHPMLGGGMALGAFAPFALPLASKVLSGGAPSANAAQTAQGLGRAMRSMRALEYRGSMGAVDMGAVDMGVLAYR